MKDHDFIKEEADDARPYTHFDWRCTKCGLEWQFGNTNSGRISDMIRGCSPTNLSEFDHIINETMPTCKECMLRKALEENYD